MAQNDAPMFRLQIVDRHGVVVRFNGGSPLELDLVETLVRTIAKQGLGLAVTQAMAEKRVRAGITEALLAFKRQTIPIAHRR